MNEERKCETCRYFQEHKGQCRRNPPVVFVVHSTQAYSCWPEVERFDWCGEWMDKVDWR